MGLKAVSALQGTQGTQGAQGAQGAQGTQGAQGAAGAQGSQGTQGAQGSQGTQGTQGTQGAQGNQGNQGTAGTSGTINSQSANYTTLASDTNNVLLHPSTDANIRTFTIDSNTNVPVASGSTLEFINQSAKPLLITITADTARYGGSTASYTTFAIMGNGTAKFRKSASTVWEVSCSDGTLCQAVTTTDASIANTVFIGFNEGKPNGGVFLDQSSTGLDILPNGSAYISQVATMGSQPSALLSSVILSAGQGSKTGPVANRSSVFNFGTGDYTIEGYFWSNNPTFATQTVLDMRVNAAADGGIIWTLNGSNLIINWANTTKITASNPSSGVWTHFALCRASASTKFFLAGTQSGSTVNSDTQNFNTFPTLTLGSTFSGGNVFWGYVAGVRVSNVARYTGTFTPPTLPLPIS